MWFDFVLSFRWLRRSLGTAVAMVATIGLGIGAATAVFSVADAVLLRPLPYPAAAQLLVIVGEMRTRNTSNLPLSQPDFLDLQRMTGDVFRSVAALQTSQVLSPREDGTLEQLRIASASTNIMSVFGTPVLFGRDFAEADGQVDGDGVGIEREPWRTSTAAILSYEYWQRRFGGRRDVVGTVVPGTSAEIVGIAGPGFELLFPAELSVERAPEVWFAARISSDERRRATFSHRVVARLHDGRSLDDAQGRADAIASALREKFPLWQTANFSLRVTPLHGYLVAASRPTVIALLGCALCLLIIGCANVANLLLLQAAARQRELAVRTALGGPRWRLARQWFVDALVIAGLGAVLGIAVAWGGLRALVAIAPPDLPRLEATSMNGTVLAFAGFISCAAAALFGVAPVFSASRGDVASLIRSVGRTPNLQPGRWARPMIVVGEIALTFALLVAAGLLLRSVVALQRIDPGFVASGLVTFRLIGPQIDDSAARESRMRELRDRIVKLPGVKAVTAASPFPLADRFGAIRWGREEALTDATKFQSADYQAVLPGYFEALQTAIVAGRAFTDSDNVPSSTAVIIDESLARKAFPDISAVGQRLLIRIRTPEPEWVQIVGVAAHQRVTALTRPGREQLFFTDGFLGHGSASRWAIRTAADVHGYGGVLRAAFADMSQVVLTEVQPMESLVDRAQAPTRFSFVLIAVLGSSAMALAVVGIYGVMAGAVRQRTAEIGVRMALGADATSIRRLFLGQGTKLGVVGVVVGLAAALALTPRVESMLVGTEATDPVTFASVGVLFLLTALSASWLPARAAARLDPADTLRSE